MNPYNTDARFDATHWTVVLDSKNPAALEHLCRTYCGPVYAYLRRRGQSPQDAQDLAQGFFEYLLSRRQIDKVEREGGKFRSWLLTCLNNFVRDEARKESAQKRGGGKIHIRIDVSSEETRFDPPTLDDPGKAYDRRWAEVLIEEVLAQLKSGCAKRAETETFETLKPFLVGDAERGSYAEPAAKLNKSEDALRVAVSRLRASFLELLRKEVGKTVAAPADVDAEIRHLFESLN